MGECFSVTVHPQSKTERLFVNLENIPLVISMSALNVQLVKNALTLLKLWSKFNFVLYYSYTSIYVYRGSYVCGHCK